MKWLQRVFGEGDQYTSETTTGRGDTAAFTGSKALATSPAPDLVDGINALAAYYRYLEAEAYDAQLKTARERRDFRDEFLQRIATLLAYQGDVEAKRQIGYQIEKEITAFESDLDFQPLRDVDAEALSRDATGYALLGLSAPLTWESLKTAYRGAARKYHPDVGGDSGTMVRLNEAYALFTAILRRSGAQQSAVNGQPMMVVDSVDKFFSKVRLTKFAALVDDLAADAAYEIYAQLSMSDIEEAYKGAELVARLCELLAAAGKSQDAAGVLNDLETLVERAGARQLNYRPFYMGASKACKDPKSARFVPNHVRQAKNLLGLGIIDQKRYDAVVKRVGAAEQQIHEDQTAFLSYVGDHQFLRLPKDLVPDDTPINGLVPAPSYYSRVETLSPVQLCEYARAFHGSATQLIPKYFAVRLDALLRAPFMGFADIHADLEELRFFAAAPGLRGTIPSLCAEAITILKFLSEISPSEREERIQLLNSLDAVPGSPMVVSVTIDASSGDVQASGPRLQRPIFLNPQYTKFATGPLERIERYVRTGSEFTASEQQAEHQRREESRAFHESDAYKRARDVTWAKQKDPEQVVEAVTALCEAIYDRIAQGDTTMDVGYWTNELTMNLLKLRLFQEALNWIDRFDSAPADVRQKTASSVVAALEKRRLRCTKAVDC